MRKAADHSAAFPILLLFFVLGQLPFVALLVHHVGVVQLGGERGLDGVDVLPAQGGPLGGLLRGELPLLGQTGQGVDTVDFLLSHHVLYIPFYYQHDPALF